MQLGRQITSPLFFFFSSATEKIVVTSDTRSVLIVTNTNGNNILKNWDPSHEYKFVTKTRDQPEPGFSFPHSPWGGEMRDPGNEVEVSFPFGFPCCRRRCCCCFFFCFLFHFICDLSKLITTRILPLVEVYSLIYLPW